MTVHRLDMQAVRPLEGLRVLDVGCGGGLLSEVHCCCLKFARSDAQH